MSLFETPTFKKIPEPEMKKPPSFEEYLEIAVAEKKAIMTAKMTEEYEFYKQAFNKMISEANKSGKGRFHNPKYGVMDDENEMFKLVRDQCIYELKQKGYNIKVYIRDMSSYDDHCSTYVCYLEFV